jgi:hypothetical protein
MTIKAVLADARYGTAQWVDAASATFGGVQVRRGLRRNQIEWQQERPSAYVALGLPSEADQAIERLREDLDQVAHYRKVDSLFQGMIDSGLIREQWDQFVRVAASLRQHTAPAHAVLERLAGSGPSDRLAKALTALGRVVKTVYILGYLNDPVLRQRVQLQLNRGESHHKLVAWLFFGPSSPC